MSANAPLDPAPQDAQLAPLRRLAQRHPGLETQVIWADDHDWNPQEDEEQGLDPEEILPYVEGLLAEGLSVAWQCLGVGAPEFLRLFVWQGRMPPLPADPDILASGQIAAA